MKLQRYTPDHHYEAPWPDNDGDWVRWKDIEVQQAIFAAVIGVVNQFANGEAGVSMDEEDQSEVARVFQLAISQVQAEQDRLATKQMLENVEKLRESKSR